MYSPLTVYTHTHTRRWWMTTRVEKFYRSHLSLRQRFALNFSSEWWTSWEREREKKSFKKPSASLFFFFFFLLGAQQNQKKISIFVCVLSNCPFFWMKKFLGVEEEEESFIPSALCWVSGAVARVYGSLLLPLCVLLWSLIISPQVETCHQRHELCDYNNCV